MMPTLAAIICGAMLITALVLCVATIVMLVWEDVVDGFWRGWDRLWLGR